MFALGSVRFQGFSRNQGFREAGGIKKLNQIKVYDDPKQFWKEVAPHLKHEEAKNSLCLGLSYIFQSNPIDCMYQSALFNDDELLGTLVCSRYRTNHNLLPSPVKDQEAANKLFDEFQKSKVAITGVVGEKDTANTYRELVAKLGKETKTHMTQGLYKCTQVKMPTLSDGLLFRIAEVRDVEKIGEWIQSFHNEAVPHDPPIDGVELAKSKIEKGMIFVVEKNSELVSMAGWSRDIETSCSVNLVFTPKNLRKNGYASIATAKLTQHLLGNGKKETNLYTDMTNPTSNKIYMDIGYEFVCDSVHFGVS